MRDAIKTVWTNPYVRVAAALATAYLLARLFVVVQPASAMFLAGWGLAYLANPLVDRIETRGVPRGLAVAIVVTVLVALALLLVGFATIAIRDVVREVDGGLTLSERAAAWLEQAPENLRRLLPGALYDALAGPLATLGDLLREAGQVLAPHAEAIGTGLYGIVSGTVTGAFFTVVALVVTIYLSYGFHRFNAAALRIVPEPYQDGVARLANTFDRVAGGYVRGQLLIALVVGVMITLGLTLVGLPLAGLIGLIAGVLNLIPLVGTVLPVVPALIIAVAEGWWTVLLVVVVFVAANQIDAQLLTPLVMARSTRLHPVTVMLSVIGGFAFGGIVAAIFAVPVAAFVKVLYTERYLSSRFYRQG